MRREIIILFWVAYLSFGLFSSCAQSIATGANFTYTICSDNTIQAWGQNTDGEFGNGTTKDTNSTPALTGVSSIKQVVAGAYHSYF